MINNVYAQNWQSWLSNNNTPDDESGIATFRVNNLEYKINLESHNDFHVICKIIDDVYYISKVNTTREISRQINDILGKTVGC